MMKFIGEKPLRFWEALAGLIAAKRATIAGDTATTAGSARTSGCDAACRQPAPRLVETKSAATATGVRSAAGPVRTTAGVTIPVEPRKTNAKRVMEALELCDEIEQLCDEVPEAGFDFAESVRENCAEVKQTITAMQMVTENQLRAIDNWLGGLRAWVRD